MKKAFKIVGVLVLAVLLALFLAPILLEDKIIERVKKEINANVNATVDFEDVNLSFIKGFPYPSLSISNLTVSGASPHEAQQLAQIDELFVKIGLASVLHSDEPIELISMTLDKPEFLIYTAKDGTTNTSVLPSNSSSDNAAYSIDIQSYKINDGAIKYIDVKGKTEATLTGINHTGKGDFSNDQFTLVTDTDIASTTLRSDNILLAKNVRIQSELPLEVNLTDNSYQFNNGLILLNAFKLNADGKVIVKDEGIQIDASSRANNNSIREFISLIPYAFTKDFEGVDASGQFDYKAKINGLYANDGSRIPTFDITAKVDNARVKYPSVNLPIEDINMSLKATNRSGQIDKTDIEIKPLHFQIDGDPFDVSLTQKQSGTSSFDLALKTDMDISKLAKACPIHDVERLVGQLKLDVTSSGKTDDLSQQRFDQLISGGTIQLEGFEYVPSGSKPILIKQLDGKFADDRLTLNNFSFESDGNDIEGSGELSHLLDYYFNGAQLQGKLVANSKLMNVNHYLEESSDTTTASVPVLDNFDQLDIDIDYTADSLIYDVYQLSHVKMDGSFSNNEITLQKTSGLNGKSDFQLNGKLSNLYDYLYASESMTGNLQVTSKEIFYEDFVEESSGETQAGEIPLIPANLDISLDVNADKVHYEQITMTDVESKLAILANQVEITEATGRTFGGKLNLAGYYNTENPTSPQFGLRYQMADMEVVKAIKSNKTFKILAPIASFIEGTFNSSFVLEGLLEDDLLPDFNTLSGTGFLETLDGKLTGYQPVERLKSYFNIDDQKEWFLKGTKNWFEIKEGALQIREFDYKVKDIPMKISGSHRFNQDMNYLIKASIPRKYVEATELGKVVSEEFDEILAQINKRGLDLQSSSYIDADILLTGNIKSPKLDIVNVRIADKPLTEQVEDQVRQKVEEKKAEIRDTVRAKIDETVTTIKDTIQTKTDELKDTIVTKAEEIIDSTKEKAKEIVIAQIDTLLTDKLPDSTVNVYKDKAIEIITRNTDMSVDSILDKIKNPFKLKKKIKGF